MKKKVIIPIVLGSISLLFGGLIYLGISAFPELLLSEEQLKTQEAERLAAYNRPVINEEPSEGAVIFSDGAFGMGEAYVPSSFAEEAVANISIKAREVKLTLDLDKTLDTTFSFVEYKSVFEDETFTISVKHDAEVVNNDEHVSYSYVEREIEEPNKTIKVNKAKANTNKTLRSNEAVVETSLLVIGAVDIFSMILIRRRRHLFR